MLGAPCGSAHGDAFVPPYVLYNKNVQRDTLAQKEKIIFADRWERDFPMLQGCQFHWVLQG